MEKKKNPDGRSRKAIAVRQTKGDGGLDQVIEWIWRSGLDSGCVLKAALKGLDDELLEKRQD